MFSGLVGWLLFGAAWFGHAFFWTIGLNWCFSFNWPRWLLKQIRFCMMALALGFPLVLLFKEPTWFRQISEQPWQQASFSSWYIWLCWLISLFYVPVVSLFREFWPDPPHARIEDSQVVDVSAELCQKPIGFGKHWRLSLLPKNQCFTVEIRQMSLKLDRLPPSLSGLRILHLSDLHFCGTPDKAFYQYAIEQALKSGIPDLVAITGDIVDSFDHHRWIVPVLGRIPSRFGIHAILGNHDALHDHRLVRRRLARVGIQVLGNSWRMTPVRDQKIAVIGQEQPWFQPAADLSGIPDDVFRLCLSHSPDQFRWAQSHAIDLVLAGHVHGGQIRIPLVGSLFVPSWYSRQFDCGAFYRNPTLMYVNRGLAGREPLRFSCRPEITWLTLETN